MRLICRHAMTLAAVMVAAASAPAQAAVNPEAYLPEDARITGRAMHSFAADGASVSVVVGDFSMTLGRRRFSGRDAVLWLHETVLAGRTYRRMEIYIEGAAEVVEPGGAVTRDRAMLVTVRHRGRLWADVDVVSDSPVENLPVYGRAVALRDAAAEGRARRADAEEIVTPAAEPAAPTPVEPPVEEPKPAKKPRPVDEPKPIAYRAASTHIKQIAREGEAGRTQQTIICTGDVYLAHGGADEIPPVEIQAAAAVLFTEDGAAADGEGEGALSKIRATGAYLEGDVRITSGDRIVRGSQLYYDFVNEQAVILDAVFAASHKRRKIPLYVRADEVRLLTGRVNGRITRRDVVFKNARISTSDFASPTYHVGVAEATLSDTTPYDEEGVALAEKSYELRGKHTTVNVRGLPLLYLPWTASRVQDTELPIHRLQLGDNGRFGLGAETKWHLFQLLGLIEPEGFETDLLFDTYEKGTGVGVDMEYAREDQFGLLLGYFVRDHTQNDDFGQDRENVPAPNERGRVLWRHKEFLPDDWQLQAEVSYLCDRNFLEAYERDEFWTGKEQESLLYARKQRDNWAFTALGKGRVNDFQTVSESYPDFAFYLLGEPLLGERLTGFVESHGGVVRLQEDTDSTDPSSPGTGRVDTRGEVDLPLHWRALNIVPYAFGRGTYWSRSVDRNDLGRAYGGGGVRMNMSFWRVFNNVHSRLFDLHRLRHVITPEAMATATASNVTPDDLYAFSPDIEERLEAFQAVRMGLRQRWETYRGRPGERRSVEFAHLNVYAALFNDTKDPGQTSDGRYFFSRPEYSITRNALNGDFALHISDATAILGDMNYDLNDREIGLASLGLAVQRDPRLRYYIGSRYIDDLDSWAWTGGLNYKINTRYELTTFQQYDLDFKGGTTLQSQVSLIRKFPRWYAAFSLIVDRTTNDVGFAITLWPEGMPEFRIGSSRVGTWEPSTLN